jgi:hypothetical protein
MFPVPYFTFRFIYLISQSPHKLFLISYDKLTFLIELQLQFSIFSVSLEAFILMGLYISSISSLFNGAVSLTQIIAYTVE